MPAISCIPPVALKRILELYGYKVHAEDGFNWSLTRDGSLPIIIPKIGELVELDVLMNALDKSKMPNDIFLSLLEVQREEASKHLQ